MRELFLDRRSKYEVIFFRYALTRETKDSIAKRKMSGIRKKIVFWLIDIPTEPDKLSPSISV